MNRNINNEPKQSLDEGSMSLQHNVLVISNHFLCYRYPGNAWPLSDPAREVRFARWGAPLSTQWSHLARVKLCSLSILSKVWKRLSRVLHNVWGFTDNITYGFSDYDCRYITICHPFTTGTLRITGYCRKSDGGKPWTFVKNVLNELIRMP